MPRTRPTFLAPALVVGALALLAAGCGGGAHRSPGVANVTSTRAAAPAQHSGLAAFSQCMRAHGVPAFPAPQGSQGIPKQQMIAASVADPSRFAAAQAACGGLLANGSLAPQESPQELRIGLADRLSFARCMRGRGVARFPDPTAQGQLTVAMVEAQGIDLHAPAVLRAVTACLPASHGLLTPAKVREALAQASG